MPRPIARSSSVAFAVGLAALLAGRDLSACSQFWGPQAEKHLGLKAVLPRNAEFHVWLPSTPEVRIDLLDARSRPVPVAVEVFAAAQSPYYMMPWRFAVIRPFRDLAPGTYGLIFGQNEQGTVPLDEVLRIGTARPTSPPPSPLELRARLAVERCLTGTHPDCGPRYGDCAFLRLEFRQPEGHWDPDLLYELTWWTPVDGVAEATRRVVRGLIAEAAPDGTQVLRVPTGAFEGIRASDASLSLELVAADHAGHRSRAARAAVEVGGFLADHPLEPSQRSRLRRTLERRYVEDLARFERAAPAGARAIFSRLEAVAPSPPGTASTRAFERAVLRQDGEVLMRAKLRGAGRRVHLTMGVDIKNGSALPEVSPERLAEVLGDLPAAGKGLESLDLRFQGDWVGVTAQTSEWGTVEAHWHPRERNRVRKAWDDHVTAVALVAGHPLYQALVAARGIPTRYPAGGFIEVRFRVSDSAALTASFSCSEGAVRSIRVWCPRQACAVGGLAPIVEAVESGPGSKASHLKLEIDAAGVVRILVYAPGEAAATQWEGKLGSPDLRPVGSGFPSGLQR